MLVRIISLNPHDDLGGSSVICVIRLNETTNKPVPRYTPYERFCPHFREASVNWLRAYTVLCFKLNISVMSPVCSSYNFLLSLTSSDGLILSDTEQAIDSGINELTSLVTVHMHLHEITWIWNYEKRGPCLLKPWVAAPWESSVKGRRGESSRQRHARKWFSFFKRLDCTRVLQGPLP